MIDESVAVAVHVLRRAIKNPGHNPSYHQQVMDRHRAEWPTLWNAIDNLLLTVSETEP